MVIENGVLKVILGQNILFVYSTMNGPIMILLV
jgi:hypothetical protein